MEIAWTNVAFRVYREFRRCSLTLVLAKWMLLIRGGTLLDVGDCGSPLANRFKNRHPLKQMASQVPPSSIDVHTFDGALVNIFVPSFKMNDDQKREYFNLFQARLTNPVAQRSVQIITESLGTPANFQPENNIDCSDLLVEIINHKNCTDLLTVIEEQLSDIVTSGLCPSGRVTRLLQVWVSLEKKAN